MGAEEPLTPACMETLAQSYAKLILEGKRTLDDILQRPPELRPRVEYLLHVDEGDSSAV